MDSGLLADAVTYLAAKELNTHSLTVVRNGYVVTDAYYYPYTRDSLHDIASVSKSISSLMTGTAIRQGMIGSVDEKLGDYIGSADAQKREIRIADLLTMRAGFFWEDSLSNARGEYEMNMSSDWLSYILSIPMGARKPGETFVYNNFAPCLNTAIVNRASGMSSRQFIETHLFGPMGIRDYDVHPDTAAAGLYGVGLMKPLDMAKIGLLMLNKGKWGSRQLVSENWVKESTRIQVPIMDGARPETNGYGYYWWTDALGSYSARGRGGQRIHVFPQEKLIVVLTGGNDDGNSAYYEIVNTLLRKYILPSVESGRPLPADEAAASKLRQAIAAAGTDQTAPSGGKNFRDRIKESHLNKTYRFSGNNLIGLKELTLTGGNFDALRMTLGIDNFTTEGLYRMEITLPLDGSAVYSPGRKGIPLMAHIADAGEDKLEIYLDEIGNIDRWGISLKFDDSGQATVTFRDVMDRGRSLQAAGSAMP